MRTRSLPLLRKRLSVALAFSALWMATALPLVDAKSPAPAKLPMTASPLRLTTPPRQTEPSATSVYTSPSPASETVVEPIELRASAVKTENYPVTLEMVLKLVEDQNLPLAQSRLNVDVLNARLRQRQVALLPNITASYSENWQKGSQRFAGGGGGSFVNVGGGAPGAPPRREDPGVQKIIQTQVGASWTLYPGGRNIYDILAAKQRKRQADVSLSDSAQEQLSQAAQEYYKLLAAYMQKGVAVRGIIEAKEQVQLNQAKVRVGNGIPLDLSRAKTSYAQQQSALVQAETAIIQAEQALLNRLNLEPTIHLAPNEQDTAKKTLLPESVAVNDLIARAVRDNPSIMVVQTELKAMGYDYKMIRSDLIPSVTLRAGINGSGSELSELQRTNSAGLTINVNLLENMGLQVPYRMQEQKKLIQQRVLEVQRLTRDVQSQVMTAFLSSENYKSAMEASEQELASAQESYDLAVGRFKAGYGVNLDVLTAEQDLATARSNLSQAVLNYNQAQVQLVEALGMATPEALAHGIQWQGTQANGSK